MATIKRLTGREILDSRGRPTVLAQIELSGGTTATASVPSGASTGRAEAVELRDGDPKRYRGLGTRKAAANISGPIAAEVCGKKLDSQADLDQLLCRLDGTESKSVLGANSLLAASIAFARACAMESGVPLYRHLALEENKSKPIALPRLTINLFSGGKHAGGQVAIQDVLIVPMAATIDQSLAMMFDIYQAAAAVQMRQGIRLLRADEGGLSPPFESVERMLAAAVAAIVDAGYSPGRDAVIAVDVAASHFYQDGHYTIDGAKLDASGMIAKLVSWLQRYPIVSIEDGLAEDDWANWPPLRQAVAGRAMTLGDDLLCTNPKRIERAIAAGAADALLLKVNQVGTLSEAAAAVALARTAGWKIVASARSGETEDDWLADLAVAWRADQNKIGSITQSERLAKYNRLLAIELDKGSHR